MMMPIINHAVEVSSKVTEVTLYPNKARESRTGKITISQTGEQEIIFRDISRYIDAQSIQVSITGVNILSVSTRVNYLGKKTDQAQMKVWKDSLQNIQDQRAWLQEKLAVAQGELKLYEQNLSIGGDQTSLYPKAVEELATLYRSKTLKIREQIFQLKKEDKSLEESIQKLQAQINAAGPNNQPVQEIVVKTNANKVGQFDFQVNYMVSQAGWTPMYDIYSKSLAQPLQLKMKAQIVQQTGYDWENVKLTLSTAQPQQNQKMPEWSTEYIDFKQEIQYVRKSAAPMMRAESKSLKDEVAGVGYIEEEPIQLVETSTAQLYQIPRSQNIASSNESKFVDISEVEMPALYKYESVPKKDLSIYLVAKVPQWESYNLLNGKANIFFEDTYVGQIYLDAKSVNDTLNISLGKDELVYIDRKSINDYTSKKLIGSNKREDKIIEISIKNNKKSSVDIVVNDQIPVSRQKDIEVTLNDSDKANYTSENGKLEWNLFLKPGESKKIRFSYTIKYPSDRNISLQ
jgi:uncharacterized protein (TIGR02231 family)